MKHLFLVFFVFFFMKIYTLKTGYTKVILKPEQQSGVVSIMMMLTSDLYTGKQDLVIKHYIKKDHLL